MKTRNVVNGILCLLVLTFGLTPMPATVLAETTTTQSEADTVIQTYLEHRHTAREALASEQQRIAKEKARLEKAIAEQTRRVSKVDQEAATLERQSDKGNSFLSTLEKVKSWLLLPLFPAAGILSMLIPFGASLGAYLMYGFIPLLALNLYLYLVFGTKGYFRKHWIIFTGVLLIFLAMFAAPLHADDLTEQERLIEQLELAGKIMKLSDEQRFLAILEGKINRSIELPRNLSSGDPLLKIYPVVRIDTAEYYMSLAALYAHEGKIGEATDAVRRIVDGSLGYSRGETDELVVNAVKYLLKHQQSQAASDLIETWLPRLTSVSRLLTLSTFLAERNMQLSAERVLSRAIALAEGVRELVYLARFFSRNGEPEKSSDSLEKAVGKVRTAGEARMTMEVAIELQSDSQMGRLIKRYPSLATGHDDYLQLIDTLRRHGRNEDAALVFAEMLKKITKSSRGYLLQLADEALKRDMHEQAISAINKLSIYLGNSAFTYRVSTAQTLARKYNLPNEDSVMLPLYYGLLNEEIGFSDKAGIAYERAVANSLKKLIESYGYDDSSSLNEYYLLGQVWQKAGNARGLAAMDVIFSELETQMLAETRADNESELKDLRQTLERLQRKQSATGARIGSLQRKIVDQRQQSLYRIAGLSALALFLVVVLMGTLVVAWRHARQLTQYRFYGFLAKWIEVMGWIHIMSVISLIPGIFEVFIGQALLIFHSLQPNSGKQQPTAAPPRAAA